MSDAAILKALINIRKRKNCPPSLKRQRSRTNWAKLIHEAGITLDAEKYYEQLVDGLALMYKECTVDEMVSHPDEAKKYCDFMRRRIGYRSLADEQILRPLMNYRKSPRGRN